jgi:membrane associated rhomboid family serine protease
MGGLERLVAGLPLLTFAFVLALGLVFYAERRLAFDVSLGGDLSYESRLAFGAISRDLAIGAGEFWRLGLAPLLHGCASHLIGNCVALTLVGMQIEPMVGPQRLAAIFVLSALGGEAGSLIGNPPNEASLGASGAIMGVIAASFVMSFSARSSDESRRMRRRALLFGVPAIAPLFLVGQGDAEAARSGVDYYAHFGGALVGGIVAFALAQAWNREFFRPPHKRLAGSAAAIALAASLLCAAMASGRYAQYQADARQFIPMAELGENFLDGANRAPEFQSQYPQDPLTPLFVAMYDLKHERADAAEAHLRAAMTAPTPLRPVAEPFVHDTARAFLAELLAYEKRRSEALDLAKPLCATSAPAGLRLLVNKRGLCQTT